MNISLVAASPMFRTLETAFLVFEPALNAKHGGRILALPDAQEVCDYPFNAGSDPTILQEKCSLHNLPVDLNKVSDGWNTKLPGSRYFPSRNALEAREKCCREQLYELASQLEESGIQDPEMRSFHMVDFFISSPKTGKIPAYSTVVAGRIRRYDPTRFGRIRRFICLRHSQVSIAEASSH